MMQFSCLYLILIQAIFASLLFYFITKIEATDKKEAVIVEQKSKLSKNMSLMERR